VDLDLEARKRGSNLRVLVTRLRYLGDVILTTPAIAALKSRYPGAEVFYLTEKRFAPILQSNPHLDGVIDTSAGFVSSIREIRRHRFTAAVDLFYNPRSAWLLFLSRIPIRIGGTRRWRKHLYTRTFNVDPQVKSAVEHHIHALGTIDVHGAAQRPRVYLDEDEARTGRDLLARFTGSDAGIVAFHPGGTWPSKRWPPASFASLAAMINERTGKEILLVTGPGEDGIVRELASVEQKAVHILPLQPVRTLAAVLAACDALVANDGGIMHLSVAIGKPTVAVFGPTDPHIWFPYGSMGPYEVVAAGVECAPCHLHRCGEMKCLDGIQAEQVYAALERVLTWRA
jgi:lipopolysaccharide heptosyltransferase II